MDGRKNSTAQLRETINTYMSQATSAEEIYAHIGENDKQSVIEKVATIHKWLEDQTVRQSERPKDVEPVLTSAEIENLKRRDELIYYAILILTNQSPNRLLYPLVQLVLARRRRRVMLRVRRLRLKVHHQRRKVIVDHLR